MAAPGQEAEWAVALEAASRGAASAVAVENDRRAAEVIRRLQASLAEMLGIDSISLRAGDGECRQDERRDPGDATLARQLNDRVIAEIGEIHSATPTRSQA